MEKSMIIIGMGPGISMGVAEKFGNNGYQIGMISRNAGKLAGYQKHLAEQGIRSVYEAADVADTGEMLRAIEKLKKLLPAISALLYNVVDARMTQLMEETADSLTNGFRISVGNALAATQALLNELTENKGSILLTGGGSGNYPNANMASISLGKAGIRNLAFQLNQALQERNIYVGTLTVSGWVNPESSTHTPAILAEKFWDMNEARSGVELVY